MAPVQRGWLGALLDRLVGWRSKLPAETNSYTIEKLRIPVGDDLQLAAELYQPVGTRPVGTLLVRSPYGIGLPVALSHARLFAARGYQVLMSNCRGTASSGGEFDPGFYEEEDGQAVVAWMGKQPWYTGSFATMGTSYLGYVQWALQSNPPRDMRAAVINTGPHSFADFVLGTGAYNSDAIAWGDFMTRMKMGYSFLSLMWYARSQKGRLRPVIDAVPLIDAVDKYFEGDTPAWLRHQLTHQDQKDAYWQRIQHDDALDRVNIPVFLVAGWFDLVLPSVMHQYEKLTERGCTVALTVGPWTHTGAGAQNTVAQALGWLNEHFLGRVVGHRPSPVRLFVTGAQEWRDLSKWPPPPLSSREFFLHPGKKLARDAPPKDAADSEFVFDPTDPTPSIGAPELFDNGGENRDTALAARSDVVIFTTEVLDRDVEVCGKPSVELHHSSDNPNVDLLVLLSEVDSRGTSRSISERYLRLDPNRGADPLNLALNDCAHRFRRGSRIRLLVAGSSHPRYIRNLGTGDDPATGSTLRPARHTIHHKASAVSKLVLPVTAEAK